MGSHRSSPARSKATRLDVIAVVNSLRRIVRALRVSARAAERDMSISVAQLFVLRQLMRSPAQSINQLAALTMTDQSSVSVVVGRLVARGLVRRRPAQDDARRVEVSLTARGRAIADSAPETAQAQLIGALEGVAPRRLRSLRIGLDDVVERMGVAGESAALFFEEGPSNGIEAGATNRRKKTTTSAQRRRALSRTRAA